MIEDVFHHAALQNLAVVHDGHMVSDFSHHAKVVGNENHAHARLGLQFAQQFEDFQLYGDIQSGSRLVGDKQFGIACDGHSNHHTLFLSS